MNVLQLMGMKSSKYGGLEEWLTEHAKQMRTRGDRLTVAYMAKPSSASFLMDLETYDVKIVVIEEKNILSQLYKIYECVKKNNIHIIHTHFDPHSYYCHMLKPFLKVRIVSSLRCFIHNKNRKRVNDFKELGKGTKLISKLRYLSSDKIISNSKSLEKQYTSLFPYYSNRTSTIYNGTKVEEITSNRDELLSKLGLEKGYVYIVNISTHNLNKRIDRTIEVISKIRERGINARLIQLGGDSSDIDYKKYLYNLGEEHLSGNIIWGGRVDNVNEYMFIADYLLHTAESEAFGNIMCEAMSQNCIPISSRCGGPEEIIGHERDGYLFDAKSTEHSEEIADFISKLQSDKAMKKTYNKNGLIKVKEKFDLTIQVSKFHSVYDEIFSHTE